MNNTDSVPSARRELMILPLRLKDGVSVIDTRKSSFFAIDFFV
jgi:hypothetical protein